MLKSDNATVTSYFDRNVISLLPSVSAEWNYNAIYQPYVTYSGDGTNVMTLADATNLMLPQSWQRENPSIHLETSTAGKITNVFTSTNSLKIMKERVLAWDNYDDNVALDLNKSNWITQISTQKLKVPTGKKSYKIIFYAKAVENNLINLSVSASHPDPIANLTYSNFVQIDNVDWTKVEILFGVRPDDVKSYYPDYDHINLLIDATNTTYSKNDWSFIIDRFEVYEISYFDFKYGNLYSKESVFAPFRPGESYVSTGNADFAIPTNFRKVVDGATIYNSDGTSKNLLTDGTKGISMWNDQMPCSPVTYSPRVLFGSTKSPLFKNGILSTFSAYKYFVSDKMNSYIGASYENKLKINKLVLKFNNSQSFPNSISVFLWNGTNKTVVSISSANISSSGTCVLYYQQDGTWSTTRWTSSQMPIFDTVNFGNFKFNGTSTSASVEIDKIVVNQVSSTVQSNYSSYGENIKNELSRFQVIEVSPRLEVDLSTYVINFDINKELDTKTNLVPISAISANSAQITLTNIPFPKAGTANSPLFLFSTNAAASPLKNLLVKNVKFYINYKINEPSITGSASIIPGGVFYVDSWDTRDIDSTTVNLYDFSKYLQLLPVNDYATANQTVFNIISNILDFGGFTDYDYDQLANVCRDKSQQLSLNYFFADSKNKTIFDVLRELFTAYQIGAFIDEYGVMRFLNLKNITKNNQTTFSLNDSNIATKSYDEVVKTKIGKINLRYKIPQIDRTISPNSDINDPIDLISKPNIIWQQDNLDVIPFNYLNQSIKSLSQHFFDLAVTDNNNIFYQFGLDGENYCIVEGEVISFSDKVYRFSTSQGKKYKDVPVSSGSDLQARIAEYAADIGFSDVKYRPTGRIANVKRGLFNTPAKTHIVMSTVDDVKSRFSSKTRKISETKFKEVDCLAPNGLNFIRVQGVSDTITHMVPNTSGDNYKTYSCKFRFPLTFDINKKIDSYDVTNDLSAGMFLGMKYDADLNSTSSTMYIEVQRKIQKNNTLKYYLNVYSIDTFGSKVEWHKLDITEQMKLVMKYDLPNIYPANNFKNFINLQCVNNTSVTKVTVSDDRFEKNTFSKTFDNLAIYINKIKICDLNISTANAGVWKSLFLIPKDGKFGFFTNGGAASSTAELAEVYATEEELLDESIQYHFQTKEYLNNLISGKNKDYRYILIQSKPEIVGLNFYDVQLNPAPSLGAEPVKISYRVITQPATTVDPPKYFDVFEDAVAYSDVLLSGFKAKFALVNASPYSIWVKKTSDSINTIDVQFAVNSQFLLTVSADRNIQRIINPSSQETVEIQTDWIQSEESARSIVNTIAGAVDNFSKDTIINMFGNPLIQIGDVAELRYRLLNIGYNADLSQGTAHAYFVQSVKQSFNQGLTTSLTLNRVSYTGPQNAIPIVYVPPVTLINSSLQQVVNVKTDPTSTIVPNQATNLAATKNLNITWDKVANATGYVVEVRVVDENDEFTNDSRDIINALVTTNQYTVLDKFTANTDRVRIVVSSYNNSSTGARGTDTVLFYNILPNDKDALASQAPSNSFRPELSEQRDYDSGNTNTGVVICNKGDWNYIDKNTTFTYEWKKLINGNWTTVTSQGQPNTYLFTNIDSSFIVKCIVTATNSIDSTSIETYQYEVVPRVTYSNPNVPSVTSASAYIGWDDALVIHWTDASYGGAKYEVKTYYTLNSGDSLGRALLSQTTLVNEGDQGLIIDASSISNGVFKYVEITTVFGSNRSQTVTISAIGPKKTSINNFKALEGGGNLLLTWDAVVGATKYVIRLSKSPDFNPSDSYYTVTTNEKVIGSYPQSQLICLSIYAVFSNNKTGPTLNTTYVSGSNVVRQIGRAEE